jgi:hypothetical protein
LNLSSTSFYPTPTSVEAVFGCGPGSDSTPFGSSSFEALKLAQSCRLSPLPSLERLMSEASTQIVVHTPMNKQGDSSSSLISAPPQAPRAMRNSGSCFAAPKKLRKQCDFGPAPPEIGEGQADCFPADFCALFGTEELLTCITSEGGEDVEYECVERSPPSGKRKLSSSVSITSNEAAMALPSFSWREVQDFRCL